MLKIDRVFKRAKRIKRIVNEDVQIQALVDGKKIIVTEASIRCDLQLQDAKGTACLPNDTIFEELARMSDMSHHKKIFVTPSLTKKVFANMKIEGKGFSRIITPLFETMMVQALEEVGEGSEVPTDTHHLSIVTQPSSSQPHRKQKSRMKQRKETEVLDLEKAKTAQAKEIAALKKRVKKLERKKKSRTSGLKRLWKVGSTTRVESSEDKEYLGDQDDASKQERMIDNIDQDVEITLVDETQWRMNDEDMFRVNDLDGDEVIMNDAAGENVEQSTKDAEKEVSTDDPVTTAEIKAAKPKAKGVIVQEPSEFITSSSSQPSQLPQAKDKEVARKVDAQMKAKMEEEERIAREKYETNIAMIEQWDEVPAKIDADMELAQKLQTEEREQLIDAEKARLFMEFFEKRRKFFARKREIKKRNIPPTKAQQRSLMCTYLKNMDGWKLKSLKKNSFDEIQKLFDSVMKKVNTFVDMNTEIVEERSKKTQAEVTEELKRCLEIVPEDDDDVTIEATTLSSNFPTIVDYKVYKERKKSYFKIIRADENSQSYLTFGKMFKNFNREDLEVLWSIVKERFKKTKPMDDMDKLLFETLKTMFEYNAEDNI
nr:hypothetical protein [Tanacetum cinerariifolium]